MKTIFTNGVFDILHLGHIRLLEFAKLIGDELIVGINSDKSVKIIKGENRPIINQWERKEILESIRWIDEVVIFNEPNPLALIKKIKPNILVKGEDWKNKKVIGSEIVDEVVFFSYSGHSTTDIIEKIKRG